VGSRDDHGRGTEPINGPARLLALHSLFSIRCNAAFKKSLAVFLLRSCPVVIPHHPPRHHVHSYRARHTKLCPQCRPPSRRIWQLLSCARSEGGPTALPLFSALVFWTRKHSHLTALSEPTLHLTASARPLSCTNARPFCPSAFYYGPTGVLFSRESVPTPTSSDVVAALVTTTTNRKLPLCATLLQWWGQLIRS
jgi:hypothetical protein